jgi:hypothetical protein
MDVRKTDGSSVVLGSRISSTAEYALTSQGNELVALTFKPEIKLSSMSI